MVEKPKTKDENICIFRSKSSRCKSNPRKNMPQMICQQHLYQYFGLEMGYTKIDGINQIAMVGGFLKPVIGKMIKSGTIIVPSKLYFDLVYRPQEIDITERDIEMNHGLHVNPQIVNVVKEYAINFPNSLDHRRIIEMYRNFSSTEIVDPGPQQKDQFPGLQAEIESLRLISRVMIRNQPVSRTFQYDNLYMDKKTELTQTANANVSVNFQYFLNHCLYSEMKFSDQKGYFSEVVEHNCKFFEDIGLVATVDIADPMYLVIDGRTSGSTIYYNSHVAMYDKNISENKYLLADFMAEDKLNEAWKGGLCP